MYGFYTENHKFVQARCYLVMSSEQTSCLVFAMAIKTTVDASEER